MRAKLVLITMCLILAGYGIAGADYLLIDQSYMANVNCWHNLAYYELDQEFSPALSSMDAAELAIHTNEGAVLQINIREGSVDGRIIGMSEELYLPPGFTDMARFIFLSPVRLNPGSSYIIDIELLEGSAYAASGFEGGGYSQGYMLIDGASNPSDNSDLIFQTGYARSDVVEIKTGGDELCGGMDSNDKLVIAIRSNDMLDATLIDPESVSFAGAGVREAGKNGRPLCRQEDSNCDGLPDLVCSIDVTQLVIEPGVLSINVTAETFDGMKISGEEIFCVAQN